MPFNIESFKASLSQDGYLQNNKYEVVIAPPLLLSAKIAQGKFSFSNSWTTANKMRFRVDTIKAPGIQILSADNAKYGVGPTQKYPFNAQFSEIGLSIISDSRGDLWQFWYEWLREVYGFTSDDSVLGLVSNLANAFGFSLPFGIGSQQYGAGYKDDYAAFIQIYIYNNVGEVVQTINLYDAFPTNMNEVQLNWGDSGQALRLGISLSFKEYTINGGSLF
jgi:hypothetical protein